MTNARATALPARRHPSRHVRGSSVVALPLGIGCGALLAIGALAATTSLPARLLQPAPEIRSVAAVLPPEPEAPRPRPAARKAEAIRHSAKPARLAAAASVRHRMRPPVVTTWMPAHLLDLPRGAEAARFEPTKDAVLASDLDGTARFVPPPAEPMTAIAAAALGPDDAPAVADGVAAVASVPTVAVLPSPETAEAALEAALVPTPSARPNRASIQPPPLALRTRPVPPVRALAYARPDAGGDAADKPIFGGLFSPKPRAGNGVAIYDIGAATVYLPNGERLEAHSGLGRMRDNPRFVHARNRGPTPPHTYDLRLRESLFHGVQAIRLTPVGGERRIYNRNGLLAHTYMLGARGDSNGCVSFKDYKRFLAAFRRGDVRRLVVVSHMNDPSSRLAALFGRRG